MTLKNNLGTRYYSAPLAKKEIFSDFAKHFISFEPWQRQAVLLSLVCKCSRTYVASLSTVFEPIFHKEFESTLKKSHSALTDSKLKNIIYSSSEVCLAMRSSSLVQDGRDNLETSLAKECTNKSSLKKLKTSTTRKRNEIQPCVRSKVSSSGNLLLKGSKQHGENSTGNFKRYQDHITQVIATWSDAEKGDCLLYLLDHMTNKETAFLADVIRQLTRSYSDVNRLPETLLSKVFQFLDISDVCNASQVCKRWRRLITRPDAWKARCHELAGKHGIQNVLLNLLEKETEYSIDWQQAYKRLLQAVKFFSAPVKDANICCEDDPISSAITVNVLRCEASDDESTNVDCILAEEARTTLDQVLLTSPDFSKFENITENSAISEEATDKETCAKHDVSCKDKRFVEDASCLVHVQESEESLTTIDEEESDTALETRSIIKKTANEKGDAEAYDVDESEYESVDIGGLKSLKRVRIFKERDDAIFTIQFDSRRVMSGCGDHKIRIWDIRSGKEVKTLSGHKGGVRCLKFDDKIIASASWDTTVIVWDVVKFHQVTVLCGHRGCVTCLDMNEDVIVSGSRDRSLRIWMRQSWNCASVLLGHQGTITSLSIDKDTVLSSSSDGTLKLWSLKSYQKLRTFYGHNAPVSDSKVYGKLVASCSLDGKVLFWDCGTGSCEAEIQASDVSILCIHFCLGRFFTGTSTGIIQEWDLETCTCLRTLTGHKGPVLCLMASSTRIVSGSADGTTRIWDLENCVQQIGGRFNAANQTIVEGCTIYESGFVPTIDMKSQQK